jgi:hypothetical protein
MSNSDGEISKQTLSSATSTAVPTAPHDDLFRAAIESAPPAPFRMLLVSLLAAAIGLVAGVVAFALHTKNTFRLQPTKQNRDTPWAFFDVPR